MLLQIAYVSRATDPTSSRDAYDIIRVAQNRNAALGLTGCLVSADGWFAQVLEGEAYQVEERLQRIAADARHVELDVRWRQPIAQRLFPGDWMALRLGVSLSPDWLADNGYEAGLPAARFDGEALLAFVRSCHAVPQG